MNILRKENNAEYDFVLKSYTDLINNFILKKEKTEPPIFIGGSPINLLKENVIELFDKSYKYNNYKYTVTPKVDGSRFLLFICESSPNTKEKKFYFIDRSLDIFNLISKEGIELKTLNLPKMLIDGEMIFCDGNKFHHFLKRIETKYLCFMVFDILYGPADIYFEDELMSTTARYRESVSMSGVIGSKIWDYYMRYNILNKLLIPSKQNNYKPELSTFIAHSSFFRIELKQILSINSLKDKEAPDKYIFSEFEKNRKEFYAFLNNYLTNSVDSEKSRNLTRNININNLMIKLKIEYDGLIFTPIDTGYMTEAWTSFKNNQFKWKPTNQQTADFLIMNTDKLIDIKNSSLKMKLVKLFIKSFDKRTNQFIHVPFILNNVQYFGLVPSNINIPDKTVCEFHYDKINNYFVFDRTREAKGANGYKVVSTILKLIENPVEITILSNFFSNDKNKVLNTVSNYLTEKQKLKLLICLKKIEIMTNDEKEKIKEFIKILNKGYYNEFKIVLTNSTLEEYNKHIKMCEIINWKPEIINYIQATNANIVSTYRYFNELKSLVRISTDKIIGENSITIKYSYVIESDLRFSVISKVEHKNGNKYDPDENNYHITNENAQRIQRYESVCFYDPNLAIKIVISKKWIINDISLEIPNKPPIYEISIENYVYKELDIEKIINFLYFYLNF